MFNFDAKQDYTLISVTSAHFDVKMAENLMQSCVQLSEKESPNFIIDFSACQTLDAAACAFLENVHNQCYNENQSFVCTGFKDELLQQLKAQNLHFTLNITPSFIEAEDIVRMENLERDLLNGLD
jgi:anti-anti-sigma regulatory factor